MEDFKFYEVGGKIRDELLGLTNKDVDYVAVPTEAVYSKIHPCEAQLSPAQLMFKALKSYLEEQKFEIFLVTLGWLSELTDLRDYIFENTNLWLKPTNEK